MRTPVTEQVVRERLAVKVRALRKKLGLTLKVAAERAEMHWRHWQKVEAAEVNVTLLTLLRIGDVLSIDPTDLIRG